MDGQSPKRRGSARAMKHARRSGKHAAGAAAVGPGLPGGRYQPLTEPDVQRVHGAALQVLETIGMAGATPWLQQLALEKGARMQAGRLCFPAPLVEDVIAAAAHEITLFARAPELDLHVGGSRVHFGTGGAAVQVLDWGSGDYRPSTLLDLYDFARLVDQLDNVHWFTRCVIATDLSDPLELDINTAYAIASGTGKHLGTAITVADNVAPVIALFDQVLGGEGRFSQRPFCKLHASPIVPPLRYGEDACEVIREAVRLGMPVNAITAAQSGATAPASLAGTLVQTVAETLAALILVNLLNPGHPFIFSNWPFVSDLRTGAFSGGGGEEALLNAAAAQLGNFYDLPSGVTAGMADSKLPDGQAGYEKALTNVLAGLAGANLVYESAGMLASLLGCSHEAFVIDNELLGLALRTVRGIEVNEDTLALDVIAEAVAGAGHFLGAKQTLSMMESEYVYPVLGDRSTPQQWLEDGARDIRDRARESVAALLASHYPRYLAAKTDTRIRERFPIRLPASAMRADSRRW